MQDNNSQSKLILAVALSFIFFIGYSYFYLEPRAQERQALQKQQDTQKIQHAKKNIQNNQNQAPQNTNTNNNVNVLSKNTNIANNINTKTPNTFLEQTKILSTIQTLDSTYYIDTLGRISQVVLKNKRYKNEDNSLVEVLNTNKLRPLELRFSDGLINNKAFKINYTTNKKELNAIKTKQTLILTQKLDDLIVTKTLTFYPDGHYDIKVNLSQNKVFYITNGFRADVQADMYADHGALVYLSDDTLEVITDGSADKIVNFNNAHIASSFDRYYSTILYDFDNLLKTTVLKDEDDNPLLFIYAQKQISLQGYIGAKSFKKLKSLHTKLTHVIEYGFFTFLAKPMFLFLQLLHNMFGNWGWTIVFATVIIKLILFPLSYKGMMSMNRLKELSPKIKALQEKHKNDKQKASMAMMELYKKEKVNPMGGCLPTVLQIPVFFAIYRVLTNAIELKGSAWMLWIDDLALMDPYYVLPILMGISMYFQQKIQPNQIQDEMQKKLFQYLPVLFTVFMLWFPAGLTLYWLCNNLFTIAQQYYINILFQKAKLARETTHNQ